MGTVLSQSLGLLVTRRRHWFQKTVFLLLGEYSSFVVWVSFFRTVHQFWQNGCIVPKFLASGSKTLGQCSIFEYCPKFFVVRDKKLGRYWDSTALLPVSVQKMLYCPIFCGSAQKVGMVLGQCCTFAGFRAEVCGSEQKVGTVLGQYCTFGSFRAEMLYCPKFYPERD